MGLMASMGQMNFQSWLILQRVFKERGHEWGMPPTQEKLSVAELRELASQKLAQGANLTRPEAAAYIGLSPRKVGRMEKSKVNPLPRCPGLGSAVRYAARDVLRFASALRKDR
jgi:DNA-binding XRE family transcriptional regulator